MATGKKWEIIHISGRPPTPVDQQHTVGVVASVIEPKHANTLVRRLNKLVPLEDLRHIKRVQKKCIEGIKQLSVVLYLALENENQWENMLMMYVAKYAASTKEEWEAQCKFWPTSYHPPTYNIDGITGFSEGDSQLIFDFMKFALKLTKFGPQVVNAAVVVDPLVRQVIASARDQTFSSRTTADKKTSFDTDFVGHPETVSSYQSNVNGIEAYDTLLSNCDSVSCLFPWKWTEKRRYTTNTGSWHPLRHAALVAIESAAARDRELFPWLGKSPDQKTEIDPAKRQKIQVSNDGDNVVLKACSNGLHSEVSKPYLCTVFDIYLVWEPCAMCAMSLVHQRFRRIFYAFPNPNCGALGSTRRLQGEKSLNHHYAVFQDGDNVVLKACSNGLHSEVSKPYLCTVFDIYLVWEPCAMCAMSLVHQRFRRIFYAFPNPNCGALGSTRRLQGEKSLNHHYAVFQVLLPGTSPL
ncbi:hypothetical protein GIB67_001726 [Kingdonia uniflora]|uniref:CMP/dCMP-type deaminase domain-containing protein n=1 Tax=Kingdonia uniflora TaxID=39325 RepID=A0A7J7LN00_9MAGN|nr:hypothetical protein GIB67_001726 [Kingdonia uniflora]